jgi:hypothetical protein
LTCSQSTTMEDISWRGRRKSLNAGQGNRPDQH